MDNNMNNMGQPVMQQPVNSGAGIDVNKIINDIKNDKKSLIAIVGALLTIIACFVNFITVKVTLVSSQTKSWSLLNISKGSDAYYEGGDYAAMFLILFAIATIALVILKKHVYTAATAGLSLITFIIEFIKVKNRYNDLLGDLGKSAKDYIKLSWGLGFFILIIGIAALGASLYLLWKEQPNCFKDAIAKVKAMFGGNKAAAPVATQAQQAPVAPVAQQAPVQPTYEAPVQNVQPTYEAPVQNVQPSYEAPVQNVQTTYQAPVTEVPTENTNNDINNNIM